MMVFKRSSSPKGKSPLILDAALPSRLPRPNNDGASETSLSPQTHPDVFPNIAGAVAAKFPPTCWSYVAMN